MPTLNDLHLKEADVKKEASVVKKELRRLQSASRKIDLRLEAGKLKKTEAKSAKKALDKAISNSEKRIATLENERKKISVRVLVLALQEERQNQKEFARLSAMNIRRKFIPMPQKDLAAPVFMEPPVRVLCSDRRVHP